MAATPKATETSPGALAPFFIVSPACWRVVREWSIGSSEVLPITSPLIGEDGAQTVSAAPS
jgi:hypothetical protein